MTKCVPGGLYVLLIWRQPYAMRGCYEHIVAVCIGPSQHPFDQRFLQMDGTLADYNAHVAVPMDKYKAPLPER